MTHEPFEAPCFYCGEPVDALDKGTYRRIVGWERKSLAESRKSGSDIALREPRDEYAHPYCVRREREKVPAGQGSLLET